MKHAAILLASAAICAASLASAADAPQWAYPANNPAYKPQPDDGTTLRVPDSTAGYTRGQVRDLFLAPVWHPGDHPPLPDIVASGRKPAVFACGVCHRADGPGGPENADLAGLPKSYIVQQIVDYRSGARSTVAPERIAPKLMISLAKPITDPEIEAAAAYFAALKPRKKITVVETDSAPKSFVAGLFYAKAPGGESEPLGERILEVPDDLTRFESRDSHTTFTAYVPPGSLAKGKELVNTGGGKTVQCAPCHGPDMRGLGPLPSIAGRSPSYMFRQLYDFQHGARTGEWSPLMAQVVSNLNDQEMLAIVAYLATLEP